MVVKLLLSELREKYQRLSLREQLLVLTVIAAAAYFLMDIFVYSGQLRREQELVSQQTLLKTQARVLEVEISVVDQTVRDSLALKEVEYQQLKKEAAQLVALSQSVNPDQPKMRELIGQLLGAQRSNVQAASLKTQPPKLLAAAGKAPDPAARAASAAAMPVAAPRAALYKHGLDIEFRGRYLDLMDYLQKLEESNPQLLWANAALSANGSGESAFRASVLLLSNQGQP